MTAEPNPPSLSASNAEEGSRTCPVPRLWRRLGLAAFLFFFIKGLLWLIVPALIAAGAFSWF